MSIKKTVAIAAAAGALAAISVPAMALENEFHGSYSFSGFFSSYNNGNSGDFTPTVKSPKMNNYFEQRARLQYIAKASNDLKMVTHFEIDNQFGKSTATTATSNKTNGVGIDADVVNIEVKHAYLDFNVGSNTNVKLGIQPYKDTLKGVFIDADVAAVVAATKMGSYTLGLGFTRLTDTYGGSTTVRNGDLNKDLFIMDNTFNVNKDTKAALSYYFLADYTTAGTKDMVHTLGLSGETKIGPAALSGFVAKQIGHKTAAANARTSYHGWAANVAAKIAAGPGSARTGLLFVSGDNNSDAGNAHENGWANSGVQSYNESGLMILTRNTANSPSNTDQYIRRVITNQAVAFLGYNTNLSEKLNLDGAVGFAWAPASVGAPTDKSLAGTPSNASDFMGTELGVTAGYKLYPSLTLQAQGGYMILGGYYKNSATGGSTPENPYTMRLQAKFAF